MIRFVPFLCGLLVIGITYVASAQPRPDADPYISRQSLSDDITLATHHNGLTIIVQENHSAPVATVRCYVKNTGSVYEGKYLGAGLSHVLEHVPNGTFEIGRAQTIWFHMARLQTTADACQLHAIFGHNFIEAFRS